jgi:hypothetical protein
MSDGRAGKDWDLSHRKDGAHRMQLMLSRRVLASRFSEFAGCRVTRVALTWAWDFCSLSGE